MLASLTVLILAAAPAKHAAKPAPAPPAASAAPLPPMPAQLPDFTGDLPAPKDLAKPPPKGGLVGGSFARVLEPNGCQAGVAVDFSRAVLISLATLEKVQAWLDANALEATLFSSKGTLGEVSKLVAGSKPVTERWCELSTTDGWKVAGTRVPPRLCSKESRFLAEYWWLHATTPSAAVVVTPSGKALGDKCAVRVSTVFYDQTGKARLQVHNDLVGRQTFTLLGDACRNVDFTFDEKLNGYKARPSKCKP